MCLLGCLYDTGEFWQLPAFWHEPAAVVKDQHADSKCTTALLDMIWRFNGCSLI